MKIGLRYRRQGTSDMTAQASRIVPLRNPTAAETLSTLAAAMSFRKADPRRRMLAGPHPPSAHECDALLRAYEGIEDRVTRQAILDVLTATDEADRRR